MKIMRSFTHLAAALAVGLFLVGSASAGTVDYRVNVDTHLAGATDGYLNFQFLQSNGWWAGDANAVISNFYTDGTLGGATLDGAVYPSPLGTTLQLANTTLDYSQAIHFGNTISFILSFVGPAPVTPQPTDDVSAASTFAMGFYDNQTNYNALLTDDPLATPYVFSVDLLADGSSTVTRFAGPEADGASVADVSPTPEPASLLMAGGALAGLALLARRRKMAR
jgi:MYXO-CTERM domain-containing protein